MKKQMKLKTFCEEFDIPGLQFWIGFTQKISQHTICVVDGMWMLKNLTDGGKNKIKCKMY